jgi:hypothetical protein
MRLRSGGALFLVRYNEVQALSQEFAMWRRTSEKQYWYALEVLPPAHQDGYGFLVGEPQDHARCEITHEVLPRFDAYVHKGKRYYVSIRAFTLPEYKKWAPKLMAGKRVK